MTELQEIKEEIGLLATRMGNTEGYFDNFGTTLNNHMMDYKAKQDSIDAKVNGIENKLAWLNWAFWVIFILLITVLAGFITGFVTLLNHYLGG